MTAVIHLRRIRIVAEGALLGCTLAGIVFGVFLSGLGLDPGKVHWAGAAVGAAAILASGLWRFA